MNNKAHSGLRTPNSSASSSTNNTPVAPNGTFAASGSTNTLRGPAPQYQTFTFGTPAEQEQASRPRRDLREQRERLNASRALQQEAARRAQSQLGGQPPLPMQHGLQPVFNPPQYPPPQPQPLHHPQAYPAGPNPNVPGPSRNALNGTANENAGFGVGHRPLGLHAQTRNAGFPPPPPIPDVSQGPMYGQQLPAPHHYGGHPGPHGHGVASNVAPFGGPYRSLPMRTPPAPAVQPALLQQGQVVPNAAPPPSARQEHMPQLPEGMNPLHQGVRQAPPAHWPPPAPFGQPYHPQQFQQAPMLPVPSVGPVEGGSMRGLKRKAVDDHHKTQTKAKRHRPQGDPNFEPAQSGPDGKLRWKCLKAACANVNPMLEDSVHKHVTQTNSHQTNSPESLTEHICPACGATFKRLDALKRHEPSGQCAKNKKSLESAQAHPQVLVNSTLAPAPSSSGPAPSSVARQSLLSPVATPHIVQPVGNSTFGAAAPAAMPQRQFTFKIQGHAPSSVARKSGVQATRTEPRSISQRVTSSSMLPHEVPSLPEVQVQQPAIALPLQAIQSTPDQTSTPLPSALQPIIAGDFSLSIFNQTSASLPPSLPSSSLSPSEDVNDSSAELFSAPSSPTPSEDELDFSLFSAPPSPG